MCATLHDNTVVKKGQIVAGTRAIPLVVKKRWCGKQWKFEKKCGRMEVRKSGRAE